MAQFKPGQSGNPAGRPKGAKNRSTELRSLLEPHAPALVEKAVQMALEGDTVALKLCLDRIIPTMRSVQMDHSYSDQPAKFVLKMGKDLKGQSL